MGNIFTKTMEDNLKKNQEFITEMNKITVERQIQMQNQMRERLTAMQVARARELLYWFGSFYILAALGMIAGFRRTKKPGVLIPLLPLSFITAYQADMAYGNKLHRIRGEAENIMQYEADLLELPCGLPTASTIDQARLDNDEKKKLHPSVPPLQLDVYITNTEHGSDDGSLTIQDGDTNSRAVQEYRDDFVVEEDSGDSIVAQEYCSDSLTT